MKTGEVAKKFINEAPSYGIDKDMAVSMLLAASSLVMQFLLEEPGVLDNFREWVGSKMPVTRANSDEHFRTIMEAAEDMLSMNKQIIDARQGSQMN